jgi:ornithine cyclodeaminase/alanine dehydrogenase-like protein (mu-crystallin family)
LGEVPGRTSADEITLFKSVGLAMQDAMTAARVYARAVAAGIGARVEL